MVVGIFLQVIPICILQFVMVFKSAFSMIYGVERLLKKISDLYFIAVDKDTSIASYLDASSKIQKIES